MKRFLINICGAAYLLSALCASAQLGSAFTFQGRLNDTNGPLNGSYDFIFTLYDNDNYPIGSSLTNGAIPVVEGQFNCTLDFGPLSFVQRTVIDDGKLNLHHSEGPGEWIEIAVRKSRSHNTPFVTLSPRQHLMPTPYAAALSMPLASRSLEGTYSSPVNLSSVSNRIQGQFSGNASGLTNVPSTSLSGAIPTTQLSTNVALRSGGNTFSGNQLVSSGNMGIGTANPEGKLDVRTTILSQGPSGNNDNLIIKKASALSAVNVQMVLSHRLSGSELWLYGHEPINGTRNLQGWDYGHNAVRFPANGQTLYIDEGAGRVGVGRLPTAQRLEVDGNMYVYGDVMGERLNVGEDNVITSEYNTIAGGSENTNSANHASIGGGWRNWVNDGYGAIGGGRNNVIAAGGLYGTVGGGTQNTVGKAFGTVSGGDKNVSSGTYSTVPGGHENIAQGYNSFAAGYKAIAAHDHSFIWNGDNTRSNKTTAVKQFEVYAPGGAHFYTGTSPLYASGDMSCATLTIRGGADLAEPFAMSGEGIPSGAVVVIDPEHPGRLKLSSEAYDQKVAGIVSGAGGIQPGISMLQTEQLEGGRNVALSGRVYALVDATQNPIRPGDLLTTSDTPGHAMKASNSTLAGGAILGKAMTPLPKGRGLVLVLVSLQ